MVFGQDPDPLWCQERLNDASKVTVYNGVLHHSDRPTQALTQHLTHIVELRPHPRFHHPSFSDRLSQQCFCKLFLPDLPPCFRHKRFKKELES